MTNWNEQVVIVTGAGGGIGKGIAEVFAQAGAEVVIAEVSEPRGQVVADELQARFQRGKFIRTDVSNVRDCQSLIDQTIRYYGHLDTLVNNAGVNFVTPTLQVQEGDWDRVIDVDLKGTFFCSRYALDAMVPRRKGTIINIASVHSVATLPEAAIYAAGKGGVHMMTCALAIEFAPYGIRINAVSPGLTDSQIWQDIQDVAEDQDSVRQHWMDNIPLGRVQMPQEVGNVVMFLASDQSSYVTGANIFTDGGMTIQLISHARYASKPLAGAVDRS
ncbi:MAG: SDR family NAD(P)-dependent oxidoreductase [Aggregatilineales bacterium]